jgi:uncharacterized protein YfbU (UPF0304 family)
LLILYNTYTLQAELESNEKYKGLFLVLNTIGFTMESEEVQVKFKDLNVDFKTIILSGLSAYYAKFCDVMSEEPGGILQQQRYKAISTQNWRTWMDKLGLIQHMLRCCGSETTMDRASRSTKNIRTKLNILLLKDETQLTPNERRNVQQYTCSVSKNRVQEEMVNEWKDMWASKTAFHDGAEDDLSRWCYILWRVLGYNVATAMKKLQHWFTLHKKLWKLEGIIDLTSTPNPSGNKLKRKSPSTSPSGTLSPLSSPSGTPSPLTNKSLPKKSKQLIGISTTLEDEMAARARAGDTLAIQYMQGYYATLANDHATNKPVHSGVHENATKIMPEHRAVHEKATENATCIRAVQTKGATTTTAVNTSSMVVSAKASKIAANNVPHRIPEAGEMWGYGNFEDTTYGLLARFLVLDGQPKLTSPSCKALRIGKLYIQCCMCVYDYNNLVVQTRVCGCAAPWRIRGLTNIPTPWGQRWCFVTAVPTSMTLQ